MARIFICYSRVDKPITEQLTILLRKAYDHVWFDENLHGGEEWWAEILRQIAACQHFLFIMSDDALESEWCRKELDEAWRLEKHVLPILVRARTNVPEKLQMIQRIDMSTGVNVDALNQLYATLIRHVRTTVISEARQKQRDGDRRLAERLWPFINGQYVEVLNEQIQKGKVDWEQYTSHIAKYLDLRAKSREQFTDISLIEAFEALDDTLIRLDGQIGWTYELRENDGRSYMSEPGTARDDSYWFQKYRRLVQQATDMWMRHAEMVETLRSVLPDFDVMKEY